MRPTVRRLLAAAGAALCLLSAGAVAAPAAQADTVRYEKVSYSPVIYQVTIRTSGNGVQRASRRPIDLPTWRAAGYPAPVTAPSTFLRLPWSHAVVASSLFGGASFYEGAIDASQWAAAGYPEPLWFRPTTTAGRGRPSSSDGAPAPGSSS